MARLSYGDTLGTYTILATLGEGGTAVVYRVRDADGRELALKVVNRDTVDDLAQRFDREVRTMTALDHPYILKVHDYGHEGDQIYVAMDVLPGGSLYLAIRRASPLPPSQIDRWLGQIASALDYAHGRSILHRDLKSHNVLLDADDNAILTDFGLVKLLEENVSVLTRTGVLLGTPAYMPPEQWLGEGLDARADVYALGVLLFELICGRLPFPPGNVVQMMHHHIYKPAPSPSSVRDDVPAAVDWIVLRALDKNPEGRFASAGELAAAFHAVISEGTWREPAPLSSSQVWRIDDEQLKAAREAMQAASMQPVNQLQIIDSQLVKAMDTMLSDQQIAAAQEERARARIEADLLIRTPRTGAHIINPLPQDVRDKFVGRFKEHADALKLLTEGARLVAIYGRGGVGKTALACKVLSDLLATEGVVSGIVALSAVSTGITLERVCADCARLLPEAGRVALLEIAHNPRMAAVDKIAALFEALAGRHIVVLLDNLETIQDADTGTLTDADVQALVEAVLRQGGPISLLVTSREPLTVPRELKPGERLVPLEEGLQSADAVALLRTSDPDNAAGLRDAPAQKLMRIAERMRGFPRALEAVAGLLLEDSLTDLDDLLRDASSLLDEEVTPLIVEQAIGRLNLGALRVLEGLAVFERPVRQSALEYLLAPYVETTGLRAQLNRLVRGYFVAFNKAVGTFALHPIDRAYCYERIPENAAPSEAAPYTRRALNLRAAEVYRAQRRAHEENKSIEDLAPQLAEIEHLLMAGEYEAAAEVVIHLDTQYLQRWGYYARLDALYGRIVPHLGKTSTKARCLVEWARSLNRRGQVAQIPGTLDEALTLARQLGLRYIEGRALQGMGIYHGQSSRHEQALPYFESALVAAREVGDATLESNLLSNLGVTYQLLRQHTRAGEMYEQGLAVARARGAHDSEITLTCNLAGVYSETGEWQRGIELYQQAIAMANQIGERRIVSNALGNLGTNYYRQGLYERAIDTLQQSVALAREIDNNRDAGYALAVLADVYLDLDEYEKAIAHARESMAFARQIADRRMETETSNILAFALLCKGDLVGARAATAEARRQDVTEHNHDAALMEGIVLLHQGDAGAQAAFADAVRLAQMLVTAQATYYDTFYKLALAKAGVAFFDPSQVETAVEAMHTATTVAAPGIFRRTLKVLDTIMQVPNGEHLAPVRAVLAG